MIPSRIIHPTRLVPPSRILLSNGEVIQPEEPDIIPPTTPKNLTATSITESEFDIAWSANTESDLAGYNVYLNGIIIATAIADTVYAITDLEPETLYTIGVSAVNTSGLESPRTSIQVATAAEPEEPPPEPVIQPEGNILFFDDFERPAAQTLGGEWEQLSGVFAITGAKAKYVSGTALAVCDVGVSDVDISVDMQLIGGAGYGGGIGFRVTDAQNYYLFRWLSNSAQLYKFVDNVATMVGSTSISAPVEGSVYVMNVRCVVDSIECSIDGTALILYNDTFNQTATKHGIREHAGAWADTFDNVTIKEVSA